MSLQRRPSFNTLRYDALYFCLMVSDLYSGFMCRPFPVIPLFQRWQIEAAHRQAEVEGLSTLAQQVVEDAHVSGRISTRVTQLTTRYHALLLQIQASQPCTFAIFMYFIISGKYSASFSKLLVSFY